MIRILFKILAFFKPRKEEPWGFGDIKWLQQKDYNDVYDPSQDPHRIMKGEIESYFE